MNPTKQQHAVNRLPARQYSAAPEKQMCFFITPLGEETSDTRKNTNFVLNEILRPALEGLPFEARSALDVGNKPDRITRQIVKAIAEAPLVIADLTGLNPNVFYELALRHAVGKPVIQIAKKGTVLPFDVQDYNTPHYDKKDSDSCKKCSEAIRQQIESCLVDNRCGKEVYSILKTQSGIEGEDELKRDLALVTQSVEGLQSLVKDIDQRTPSTQLIEDYREEIAILKSLRESGVISPYRNRELAIRAFSSSIDAEPSEIMVTGSSLLGLLQNDSYKDLAGKLEHKTKLNVRVKLLLTHPKIADLRAEQENRKFEAIGQEIVRSLQILRNWEVPPEVRLYLGTPTIFAIKTKRDMLLNFYAYKSYPHESPCLIVNKDEGLHFAYFYDEYDRAHFGAWDSSATETITDYETATSNGHVDSAKLRKQIDVKIRELQQNLPKYSECIAAILKNKDSTQKT